MRLNSVFLLTEFTLLLSLYLIKIKDENNKNNFTISKK